VVHGLNLSPWVLYRLCKPEHQLVGPADVKTVTEVLKTKNKKQQNGFEIAVPVSQSFVSGN